MRNKYKISSLLIILFTVFLHFGCSTQKNSFVNRTWHNINAKYNGFWNARESFNEGVKRLGELHSDNYEETLSIFRYGNEQDAASVRSNMEVTYEKASLVIRRHSMDIRGVEYNKWIDESYFLIARSHFFKRDYTLAILTFEYIIRRYDTQRRYDSKVWVAKSYHQQERYEQALRILEDVESDYNEGLLSRETTALFRLAYADHFVGQEKYALAAAQLEKGIHYMEHRQDRVRYTFIQAQLYHHSEDYALAQQAYARVLNMRPDYQMAFQARIGMAMAYDPTVGGGAGIRNELMNMLSDDRNRVFRDQIYYALAQLAVRQGDKQEAIRLFTSSYESSEENDLQKALAFLRLGEIYFDEPDYVKAGNYYDSTITYISSGYEHFENIRRRQMVLSRLIQQIRIIEHEDSLQRLAGLSEAEQRAVADKIIQELREEERRQQEEERERQAAMRDAARMARDTRRMGDQERGWYFYNSTAMANGELEFFSKFGDRPLEDMWRISNRQMMADGFGMDFFDDMEEEEPEEELDQFDVETYLRNIPNTEEQMEASNNRKSQAYFTKAMLFKDQLRDMENAISSFNGLVDNFPNSPLTLNGYYYLYYMYRERGDHSIAETIKNRLLSEHPDSEYAKIIGDPNYVNRVRDRQNRVARLYKESYHAFFAGRYDVISRNIRALDTLEASRQERAQFAYLHALAIGKTDDQWLFRNELQQVVDQFDDTKVYEPASILLASLDLPPDYGEPEEPTRRIVREDIESPFSYGPDDVHFFIIVLETRRINPNEIGNKLSAFHDENFSDKELSVSNIHFEEGKQIITITNFANKELGMSYFQSLMESDTLTGEELSRMEAFVISVENYPLFYQDKKLDEYRRFFDHYYLDM